MGEEKLRGVVPRRILPIYHPPQRLCVPVREYAVDECGVVVGRWRRGKVEVFVGAPGGPEVDGAVVVERVGRGDEEDCKGGVEIGGCRDWAGEGGDGGEGEGEEEVSEYKGWNMHFLGGVKI